MEHLRLMMTLPYVFSGLFTVLGLPLAFGWISPNHFYGVRTRETLENPDLWYSANFVGGISMVVAGVLSGLIVYALHRHWGVDSELKVMFAFFIPIVFILFTVMVSLKAA